MPDPPPPPRTACGPECQGGHERLHAALEQLDVIAHGLSVGAVAAGHGVPVAGVGRDYPGLRQVHDVVMTAFCARAESMALIRLLTNGEPVTRVAFEAAVAHAVEELVQQRGGTLLQQVLAQRLTEGPPMVVQLQAASPGAPPASTGQEVA